MLTCAAFRSYIGSLHLHTCSQEKGEYEKWASKNEFQIKDLVDVPDFIEDVKDETSWMVDWDKGKENNEESGDPKKEKES